MGNTNFPQAGAAGTENSRDTLSGDDQLTDEQKKERQDAQKSGIGPAPGRPQMRPSASPVSAEGVERVTEDDGKRDRDAEVERPANDDPYNPRNTTGAGDPAVPGGHPATERLPSDAS